MERPSGHKRAALDVGEDIAKAEEERPTEQTAGSEEQAAEEILQPADSKAKKRKMHASQRAQGSVSKVAAEKEEQAHELEHHVQAAGKGDPGSRVAILRGMKTPEDMKRLLAEHGRSERDFKVGEVIEVDDLMQSGYSYRLEAPIGESFSDTFEPHFSPKEMLALGVFEGKYMNDGIFEYPKEWYEEAMEKDKLSPQGADEAKNRFHIKSRLPLSEWRKKGWVPPNDPRGWFQWYCRYYLGRRDRGVDPHQISRWRQLRRHAGQIRAHCHPGDLSCRPKQRQALLNWAHDCFI